MARSAKAKRDDVNKKVASLKKEMMLKQSEETLHRSQRHP